jgi:hypothetical protein
VNRLKVVVAMTVLALWIPATSLCLMENAGWLAKNDGCCDDQSSTVLPCCALASAAYKIEDGRSATVSPAQQIPLLTDLAHLDQPVPQQFARVRQSGVSPPELSTSWQFSSRAAPAPRAPSSAS